MGRGAPALVPLRLHHRAGGNPLGDLARGGPQAGSHRGERPRAGGGGIDSAALDRQPGEVRLQLSRAETPPVFVAVVQDLTERRRAEQKLKIMASQLARSAKTEPIDLLGETALLQ